MVLFPGYQAELCKNEGFMCRHSHIRSLTPGKLRGLYLLPSHGAEVYLNPAESTVFRLFLAHPEGISSDNLLSHWKELCRIYSQESLFDDPSR